MQVATGANGVCAGLSAGKGYVDVSTVDGATSAVINEAVHKTGCADMEAWFSGGPHT